MKIHFSFFVLHSCFRIVTLIMVLVVIWECNNPFSTREPEKPDQYSGVAIKPANTPENVLYNLRASFESLSVQDYIAIFSNDFAFSPHPDDSLLYLEDFRNGWGYDQEKIFAENFLQKSVTSEIEVYPFYEYKPGQDMYDYTYSMKVFSADSTKVIPFEVKGHAWIYFREVEDGTWKIYHWVEFQNMIQDKFITWGVLRALYI